MTKQCEKCGVMFARKPSCVGRDWEKQRFCSQVCWGLSRRRSITERFWMYVSKSDGCWLWTGAVDGYAPHQYGSLASGSGTSRLKAHRVSYEIANGEIPEGMMVCHTCDNPLCVRPDHLFVGTQTDNMRDMVQKHRATTALSLDRENAAIALVESGMMQKDVAVKFGVHKQTISRIIARRKAN